MTAPAIAFLGLGANLGEREANIRGALERLALTPGVSVLEVSTLRETDPVGGPSQPKFLNGAARISTVLSPLALLEVLRVLEAEAGRDLTALANHPRTLDLDLLIYGDRSTDSKTLQLPHPRLWDREFVLEPLRELGCPIPARPKIDRPQCISDLPALALKSEEWRSAGLSIGFVPTMGALHAGHASLFRRARRECDRLVVSIFVNPLQFGPNEDFDCYPRTQEADLEVLGAERVDLLFEPTAQDLFHDGYASRIEVGREAEGMEGASRQGHFMGVATVVARLWLLIHPDRGFFGRKDAQQLAVLRRMHQDLSLSGEIVACPILRDIDGLALSSRNRHLGSGDRSASLALHRALQRAREAFASGERRPARLIAMAQEVLQAEPRCHLDYLELRDGDALAAPGEVASERTVMLVAAVIGESKESGTRLIDNMQLEGAES